MDRPWLRLFSVPVIHGKDKILQIDAIKNLLEENDDLAIMSDVPVLSCILWFLLFRPCFCYALVDPLGARISRGGSAIGMQKTLAMETSSEDNGEPITKVLIAMDCLCSYHGGYLATRALEIPGVAVVHVLSEYLESYLRSIGAAEEDDLFARRTPRTLEEAQRFLEAIGKGVECVAVYCESDSGLRDAEKLRELVGVTCVDDPIVHEARRNKNLMYQKVKEAGLYVAKSQLCSSIDEALKVFAETMQGQRVVVKPFRGVASESVTLCKTKEDILAAWEKITSSQVFGSAERHSNVLVQEFVEGTEYAVDVVSRNGQHKVAAVWRYVKKPVHDASFCYFKTELVDSSMDENVPEICAYILESLHALGVKWGISHNEVILRKTGAGPAFIEMNMRQHNMDFLPLTMSCIGYNAFDMYLLALFFDAEEWEACPDIPSLRFVGCMVHLVNSQSGKLVANHHIEEMSKLPSVFDFEVYEAFRTPGELITPTIDIRTDAGWVQLINPERDAMSNDYAKIESWMATMFETSK